MKSIFLKQMRLKRKQELIKRIFFYRICGTGMGAAATLLKEAGYLIEGGDNEFYPPMSNYLEASNIPLKKLSDCDENYLKVLT